MFDLWKFDHFVTGGVSILDNYDPFQLHVATLVLQDVDMRDMTVPDIYKTWMHSFYLPLASQTQFVEAGVKEAKIVSTTDRSEQLRSIYAINRSARVHTAAGDKTLSDISSTEQIACLINSASQHIDDHDRFKFGNNNYKPSIDAIANSIRADHFKNSRVAQLKDIVHNKGNINKKDNVLQQKTGVDRTLNMLGFVAYGKMKKAVHHLPLLQELLHRGCNRNESVTWTFTECRKRLKDMEILRLANSSAAMKSAANKGFQPLSTAVFQID